MDDVDVRSSWTADFDVLANTCKMTKLLEWLCGLVTLLGVWTALLTSPLAERWTHVIAPAPLVCLLLFGIYSVTVVLWRVFNFNDCQEAAEELKKQIMEAKTDLQSKGIKFQQ